MCRFYLENLKVVVGFGYGSSEDSFFFNVEMYSCVLVFFIGRLIENENFFYWELMKSYGKVDCRKYF